MEGVRSVVAKGMVEMGWQDCDVQYWNRLANAFKTQQGGLQLDMKKDGGQWRRINVNWNSVV